MGVEWSSWKITRRPFGRKYCVYLIGGSTGAPVAFVFSAAPFGLFPFCASVVIAGANRSAASVTNAIRFQNIFTPPRDFESIARVDSAPLRRLAARAFVRSVGFMNPGDCYGSLQTEILTR